MNNTPWTHRGTSPKQIVRPADVREGDHVFVSDRRSLRVDKVITGEDMTLVFISEQRTASRAR